MAKRFNIRMAGVGGQGVVTGSHILSTAVINAGGESTIVPFYGSEKRMAPVESYVRVSDEPIFEIGEITFPHTIINRIIPASLNDRNVLIDQFLLPHSQYCGYQCGGGEYHRSLLRI